MATWLSGAKRQSWGRDGGSFTTSPDKILLHSTETGSFPGYGGGASAPHFTINLGNGEVRQHSPMNRAARALRNASGGVQTNRDGVIQIEIIGTCDKSFARKHGYPYLPDMTDEMAGRLKWLLQKICAAIPAIPLTTSVAWKSYPSSYGNSSVRMSNSQWTRYKGILGHQHAPENTHGDPGDLPMEKILGADAVKGGSSSGGGGGGGKYESPTAKHEVGSRVMGLYDGGTDVNWLQRRLPKVGYSAGAVDGYFGPSVEKAVKKFQKAAGVAVDSLVGKNTLAALKAADEVAEAPKQKPSGSKAPKFPLPSGHWMGVESSNPKNHSGYYSKDRAGIKLWQARMKKRGWSISVDGYYGEQSERVARQFQKQVKVAQDGLVGEVTFAKSWTAPIT